MNHHNTKRKLGRERKVRNALVKSLVLSLIMKGKIKTTDAKARALRPVVEKMITAGMSGTIAAQRLLSAKVGVAGAKKILAELSPKYKDRKGGYTRITKLPARLSDNALMAIIEFV
jgi:large subunit ribosomal protein L17